MEFNPNETPEEKQRGIELAKERSQRLWTRYNPGFIDDTSEWCSTSKATYTASQFTLMKDPDTADLTYHRKKNESTEYMEASVRQKNMMNLKPTGNATQ